jgi:hypothetical protein
MPGVFLEAEEYHRRQKENNRIDDTLYELVARLTKSTGEITFACIPSIGTSYYLGLSNYLERHR